MRKLALILGLASALSAAMPAQTVSRYLELRKKHKITQAAEVAALEAFIGRRVIEIKGTVTGSIRSQSGASLLVERTDGASLMVEAPNMPDWISGSRVSARLLVEAERTEEHGDMRATLLGVAPEHSVAAFEAAEMRRAAKAAPKSAPASATRKTTPKDWSLPAHQATPHYAAFIRAYNRSLTDAQAIEIATGIIGFSLRYGVDARLIMAMVLVESGFNPAATSRAGAQGLGQLMPGTAAGLGITDAYDTLQNLYGTVRVIRGHIERYQAKTGDNFQALVLALAAYNAGSGAVRRHGGVPPYEETQNYLRKVAELYFRLAEVK
jgi:soluble lytic murein transglycosylase-like protein